MSKKSLIVLFTCMVFAGSAQMVATVEMKEEVKGICDHKKVYAIFPMFGGQKEALCNVSKEEIAKKLNEIQFIKDNPKHKDKGMVSIYVNCKGEVVKCATDNKTKDPELDKQVLEVFKTLSFSMPAQMGDRAVDSCLLYSFEVKKGKVIYE
jgi:hypothetical protein